MWYVEGLTNRLDVSSEQWIARPKNSLHSKFQLSACLGIREEIGVRPILDDREYIQDTTFLTPLRPKADWVEDGLGETGEQKP